MMALDDADMKNMEITNEMTNLYPYIPLPLMVKWIITYYVCMYHFRCKVIIHYNLILDLHI